MAQKQSVKDKKSTALVKVGSNGAKPNGTRIKRGIKYKACQGEKCKGKKEYPLSSFGDNKLAKDGKRNYCDECYALMVKRTVETRKARKEQGLPPLRDVSRWRGDAEPVKRRGKSNGKGELEAANAALRAANGAKDHFLIVADDGDSEEFTNRKRALAKALEWKLGGHEVTIWRRCQLQFSMDILE